MVHTLGENPYQVYNKMSDGVPGYDGLGMMGSYYVWCSFAPVPRSRVPPAFRFPFH